MTAPEFDGAFEDVLEDVLGWEVVDDQDGGASAVAWDSLMQIRLIHALELRFDIRLPDSALLEEQSVTSLKRLVHERLG